MLYFTYGSNMDWARIRERCPSARFVSKALLRNYRLTFPRYSKNNESWTASVEKIDGEAVWGVVYEIDDRDIGRLNKAEGYRPDRPANQNSHLPIQCHVFDEGDKEKPIAVMTYIANGEGKLPGRSANQRAPKADYRARLIDGAKHWRLPDEYILRLEDIEVAK